MAEPANPLEGFFSPEFVADPYPYYARLCEADTFLHVPEMNMWMASRFEDCQAILRDRRFGHDFERRLSEANGPEIFEQPAYAALSRMMLMKDPPDHKRLRSLVVKAFDARSIDGMRGRIRAITESLIDAMGAHGSGDLMRLFAHPLPVLVICELLGIPEADRARFAGEYGVGGRILDPTPMNEEELAQANAGISESADYFAALCDERRRRPQDDLLTHLVESETEHGKLSTDELTANITLLFGAGHETTVNLIGNGLVTLYRHPQQLERLRADPDLIPNAVEEMLRFESSVQFSGRTALEDVDWHGRHIRRGEEVLTLLAAANRDPEVFDDPDVFDVARPNARSIAFGGGIHFCLGAQLARIEAAEAFAALLARLPALELDDPVNVEWKPTITLRGLARLPARW